MKGLLGTSDDDSNDSDSSEVLCTRHVRRSTRLRKRSANEPKPSASSIGSKGRRSSHKSSSSEHIGSSLSSCVEKDVLPQPAQKQLGKRCRSNDAGDGPSSLNDMDEHFADPEQFSCGSSNSSSSSSSSSPPRMNYGSLHDLHPQRMSPSRMNFGSLHDLHPQQMSPLRMNYGSLRDLHPLDLGEATDYSSTPLDVDSEDDYSSTLCRASSGFDSSSSCTSIPMLCTSKGPGRPVSKHDRKNVLRRQAYRERRNAADDAVLRKRGRPANPNPSIPQLRKRERAQEYAREREQVAEVKKLWSDGDASARSQECLLAVCKTKTGQRNFPVISAQLSQRSTLSEIGQSTVELTKQASQHIKAPMLRLTTTHVRNVTAAAKLFGTTTQQVYKARCTMENADALPACFKHKYAPGTTRRKLADIQSEMYCKYFKGMCTALSGARTETLVMTLLHVEMDIHLYAVYPKLLRDLCHDEPHFVSECSDVGETKRTKFQKAIVAISLTLGISIRLTSTSPADEGGWAR